MTPKKAAQEKRNKEIVSRYLNLKKEYPSTSDNLIYQEIAKDFNIQGPAIRAICKAAGVC